MHMTRRSLLRRGLATIGTLVFADILNVRFPQTALGCSPQWPPVYRSQFDGSFCQYVNCGPTSAAMVRSSESCNAYNPTGATLRIWYDRAVYGHDCGTNGGPIAPCTGQPCPDAGTTYTGLGQALALPPGRQTMWDGGPAYNSKAYTLLWANFVNDLKTGGPGYCAVMNGNYDTMPAKFKCDSQAHGGHSVFVLYADSAGSMFTVYDPDNCQSQPNAWSQSELYQFMNGLYGDGYVRCVLGKQS